MRWKNAIQVCPKALTMPLGKNLNNFFAVETAKSLSSSKTTEQVQMSQCLLKSSSVSWPLASEPSLIKAIQKKLKAKRKTLFSRRGLMREKGSRKMIKRLRPLRGEYHKAYPIRKYGFVRFRHKTYSRRKKIIKTVGKDYGGSGLKVKALQGAIEQDSAVPDKRMTGKSKTAQISAK